MNAHLEKSRGEATPTAEMIARRHEENRLRDYIRDNIIHPKELKEKARAAKEKAWQLANEASNDSRNEDGLVRPNDKGRRALEELSEELRDDIVAHGVGSNLPTTDPDFPMSALISILATGELKGDYTRLSGASNQVVFTNAPFILLSNRGEKLAEYVGNTQKLQGLRTVLVNGEYDGIIDDLRAAFPHVSFRTAEQVTDEVFEKKYPPYQSYEDQIKKRLDRNG